MEKNKRIKSNGGTNLRNYSAVAVLLAVALSACGPGLPMSRKDLVSQPAATPESTAKGKSDLEKTLREKMKNVKGTEDLPLVDAGIPGMKTEITPEIAPKVIADGPSAETKVDPRTADVTEVAQNSSSRQAVEGQEAKQIEIEELYKDKKIANKDPEVTSIFSFDLSKSTAVKNRKLKKASLILVPTEKKLESTEAGKLCLVGATACIEGVEASLVKALNEAKEEEFDEISKTAKAPCSVEIDLTSVQSNLEKLGKITFEFSSEKVSLAEKPVLVLEWEAFPSAVTAPAPAPQK